LMSDAREFTVRLDREDRRRLELAALNARTSKASLLRHLLRRTLRADLSPPTSAPTTPAPGDGVELHILLDPADLAALRALSSETGTPMAELVRSSLRATLKRHAVKAAGSKT